MKVNINGHEFEVIYHVGEQIDVTSLARPDPTWRYTDRAGHAFQWFVALPVGGKPMVEYHATKEHYVPGLRRVTDSEGTDDRPEEWHWECALCGERVEPGYCPDNTKQYIAGIEREPTYLIDGERVFFSEFKRRAIEEAKRSGLTLPFPGA